MQRRRHTRDGTRRRSFGLPYIQTYSPGNTGRDQYDEPRSDENVAAREAEAQSAYNNAAAASANSNVTAYLAAVQEAALAAALARSGANSTNDETDAADAADAEGWASAAVSFSTFSCSVSECRTRGGTATLIGYSEFTGYASTPPKKYRRKDLSHNSWYRCYYTDVGCTTLGGSDTVRRTGYCVYNALTGVLDSSAALQEVLTNPGVCADGGTLSSSTNDCPAEFTAITGASVTNTATTNQRTGAGACNNKEKFFGNQVQTLSVEDTEADALVRLQASASWSAWSAAGSTSCLAKYETRTAGFSFAWQEAQFRATISIASGTSGIVKVGVYRRAYGSGGAWTQISTEIFNVTGNGSNEDTIEMDVPNAAGYETYVACLAAGT